MAFFGLTQIGYQDTIRENVREPEVTPQYIFRSGLYRDPTFQISHQVTKKQDSEAASGGATASNAARYGTIFYGPGHRGSNSEFTKMKEKHAVNPEGLTEIYRRPVITSADIARWRKDEPLPVKEPWTHVKRRAHVNSEMTRFVDRMATTNRDFSLF